MSKVARIVGVIATVVAIAAAVAIPFVGAAAAATLMTVAAIASAVAAVANAVAIATQKPPDLKGAINQVLIGANMPVPYTMGRTYCAGNLVYDDSNGTNNVDRTQIMVGSVAGPIESFEALQADFATIPFSLTSGGRIEGKATDAWYGADDGYLWVNSRLGARPDTALTPFSGRAAFRNWGSSNKLSGMPAWSVTMEFDEKGKRWSGGIPAWGMIAKWVKTYDPRKDSSYLGGSGTQRWDDESTWEYGAAGVGTVAQGENPALHALAYAFGRNVNGTKVVGVGLDEAQINVARFVEAANLCDANGWVMGGTIYEGPGISKWDNLKRICAAFGAMPVWNGGLLDLKLSKPVVALDTITRDDLAGDSIVVPAMKSWRDRVNTVVPRYRSELHRWDYVQSDAVTNATYVTEDGETKTKEVQYDLVQNKDQAAQLGAYELVNGREFGPVQLTCKPRLMLYRVGEAVNLDLASLLDDPLLPVQTAIITSRSVDPATGVIRFTFESETSAKHAWALARTGTAPPTPSIFAPGDVDQAAVTANETDADIMQKVLNSTTSGLTYTVDSLGVATVSNHIRIYPDKQVNVTGDTVAAPAGVTTGDNVGVFYGDRARAGGAVVYASFKIGPGDELPGPTPSAPDFHMVGIAPVPASGITTASTVIGDSDPGTVLGGIRGGFSSNPLP
jgi:hypothetical protein